MTAGVGRDRWGIPHVVAGSLLRVAREQGRAVVEDRWWQVAHVRLKAEGRTAGVVGEHGVPWDRFARRVDLVGLARTAYDGLAAESAAFVAAYVEGLNEGLAGARSADRRPPELAGTGHVPEPWEPWTPLAVFAAHHVLFATLPAKLWRGHLRATVGEELAGLFRHEPVPGSGSNSWAVGGARTASGLPMIAGDPHRAFERPNGYQQVRLTCTDPDDPFDVAGFTFPGVPGVQHFAHAGSVAWGITNATADYQDVFVEHLERRDGEVVVRTADGWRSACVRTESVEVAGGATETVEVVRTPLGPVVQGGPGEPAYSLRTPMTALRAVGFDALVPLLRARTAADVEAALACWVEPVNNLLVADSTGAVRQRVVGRVPDRDEANRHVPVPAWEERRHWRGWLDLPHGEVEPDGQVVTANHRMSADFDRIGVDFAPPGRARRIESLLDGRSGLAPDDFEAVQRDVLAGQPAALHAAVVGLRGLSVDGERLRSRVAAWDLTFGADSTAAAAYVDVRSRFVERLAGEPELAVLAESPFDPVFAAWTDVPTELYLSLANVLTPRGRRLLPGVDRVLAEAVEQVAAQPESRWGDRHRYAPYHPLRPGLVDAPGLAGDNDCVRCTGARPGSDLAQRGSVARYVWDLAGLDRSGWVVPLGADGDESSPHALDQLDAWVEGRLIPVEEAPGLHLSQRVVGPAAGS
jgi:penicillin G amidase